MIFQKEYDILKTLDNERILEIAFDFKNHKIKIYFTQRKDYEFLVLICENETLTFVKNFGIYFENDQARINGYWGKYYDYARGLQNNNTDYSFSEFYNKLRQAIQSVTINNPEFTITYYSEKDALPKIQKATEKSVLPQENIYFHYIRRVPITDEQFDKVKNLLGEDVAKYLKHSNLTAVFTSDITKQKSFILVPQD